MEASESKRLISEPKAFRDECDWARFHNPKDLALGLSIDAAEHNELFLWKDANDADLNRLAEELADVFAYALLLLEHFDLDLEATVRRKIEINEKNYPVELSRGNAEKPH